MYINAVGLQEINKNNPCFKGTIHKSVTKIFRDFSKDMPEAEKLAPAELYDTLKDFVSKTDKNIEMYWHNNSMLDGLKGLSSPSSTYEGFMFRNKMTNKKIRGSAYPDNYFSDFVYHPPDETKYINDKGVTAQGPDIYPKHRRFITGQKSSYIDSWKQECDTLYWQIAPGTLYEGYGFDKVSPITSALLGLVQKTIGLIPKLETKKYTFTELLSLQRYVKELTTKVSPSDIDKMLV